MPAERNEEEKQNGEACGTGGQNKLAPAASPRVGKSQTREPATDGHDLIHTPQLRVDVSSNPGIRRCLVGQIDDGWPAGGLDFLGFSGGWLVVKSSRANEYAELSTHKRSGSRNNGTRPSCGASSENRAVELRDNPHTR